MIRLPLLLLFSVFFADAFCQHFMLDKRSKIKKNMEKFYADNNRKYAYAETGSSISFTLNDSLSLPVTTVFYFNEQNRCIKQENIFTCDSCLQKSMQNALAEKFVSWHEINPGTYYAGFPYNTLMEQVRIDKKFILRFSRQKKKELR